MNINAAPLDHAGYATVKAAGIGTYQIFQETYHHETYARVHPAGTRKGDYLWRLDGVARAMEAGLRRRGHRGAVRPVRLAVRGARAGGPRPALAEALRRRPAHDQLPAAAAGQRRRRSTRRYLVGDARLQAAGGHPAAVGALHGPDPHRPRAGRAAPRGDGLRRFADRRRQPHRAGRLHRGRRRAGAWSASSSSWATSARWTR